MANLEKGNDGSGHLLSVLDKSFASTCSMLFWESLGTMGKNSKFLGTHAHAMQSSKSELSGKQVYYCAPYGPESGFISFSEKTAWQKAGKSKIPPGWIRDIDSLFENFGEIACYSGDKILGESKYVEKSDNVSNSFYIYSSHDVLKSEYAAYSDLLLSSKHVFGSSSMGYCSFCLNSTEAYKSARIFESGISIESSDLYYSFYSKGCHDCMFCLNQDSKRNMIGNNQLEKGRYREMKLELLSQIRDSVKAGRRIPSLADIMG
ncbi:MAG: hypothetical protein WC506_01330 [Candidatus Micrarchaeia archaeon]